jgi:hypothetical protein
MHVDALWNNIASDNLSLLCDLEFILSLHKMLSLLDVFMPWLNLSIFMN